MLENMDQKTPKVNTFQEVTIINPFYGAVFILYPWAYKKETISMRWVKCNINKQLVTEHLTSLE